MLVATLSCFRCSIVHCLTNKQTESIKFFIICILLAFLVSRRDTNRSFVASMMEKDKTENVKEIKSPSVKKIPEDKVKEEIKKEVVKQEALKKKPVAPTE